MSFIQEAMIHECKNDMSYFLQANLDSVETCNRALLVSHGFRDRLMQDNKDELYNTTESGKRGWKL